MIRNTNPKLALCITMYNETEDDFKYTMRGVLQNYIALREDPYTQFRSKDFVVVVVVDGMENIPASFL